MDLGWSMRRRVQLLEHDSVSYDGGMVGYLTWLPACLRVSYKFCDMIVEFELQRTYAKWRPPKRRPQSKSLGLDSLQQALRGPQQCREKVQ